MLVLLLFAWECGSGRGCAGFNNDRHQFWAHEFSEQWVIGDWRNITCKVPCPSSGLSSSGLLVAVVRNGVLSMVDLHSSYYKPPGSPTLVIRIAGKPRN